MPTQSGPFDFGGSKNLPGRRVLEGVSVNQPNQSSPEAKKAFTFFVVDTNATGDDGLECRYAGYLRDN